MKKNNWRCMVTIFMLTLFLFSSTSAFADLCSVNNDPLESAFRLFGADPIITDSLPTTYAPLDFGGVSLNRTANLMLNLEDISGAVFDEATGQIILYGKNNVSLPAMTLDDLAVAIRSEYGYGGIPAEDPGVSIDPEASTPGQMKVRYYGQTSNTAFGYTMFESDRLLKVYSLGKDNITGASVTSAVPGYVSLTDRYRNAGSSSLPLGPSRVRMWFVPKEVSLIQSSDYSTMLFSSATIEVLTESKFQDNVMADPVSEAFTSHFNLHYDDFAIEKPILNELKRLSKITAVVKWIKDNNIPFDLSYLETYTPAYDSRPPDYTPLTTVTREWIEGALEYTLTITGGVTYRLDAGNFTSSQGVMADQVKAAVIATRPGEDNFSWGFSAGSDSYQAVAQSMSRSRKDGNIKRTEIDMMFPVQGNNPLILYRYYNSFNDKSSGFGLGWETSPYKLRFPATKLNFTFGSQSITASAYDQIFVSEKGREQLFTLTGLDSLGNPVYLREGGKDYLKAESNDFVLYKRNQGTVTFDGDGKFTRITDSNGISINYSYSGPNLVSITHQGGRNITLSYTNGKVTSAAGPGGKTITYTYTANGDLETVKNQENEVVTYQYDSEQRMNGVIDPRGNAVFHASFDAWNRAIEQTVGSSASYTRSFNQESRMSTVTDPKNIRYTQTYDADYRFLNMIDTANRKLNVSYAGEFGPAAVTDSKNNTTEYRYDVAGNINYVKDGTNTTRLFAYDVDNNPTITRDGRGYDTVNIYDQQNRLTEIRHVAQVYLEPDGMLGNNFSFDTSYITSFTYDPTTGNLLSVKDQEGRIQQFAYDVNGLPKTSTLQGGYTVTNTYDARSRLQNVTNPAGESITYGYDNADRVTSITTAVGVIRYAYDKNGNVATIHDGRNNPTTYEYNINNRVTRVTDAESGVTGYQYDSTNTLLSRITLPNGSVKTVGYDNLNHPISENSQVPDSAPKPMVLQSAVSMGSTTAGVPSSRYVSVCNSGQVSTSITGAATNNPLFTVNPLSVSLLSQQCVDLTVTFNGTSIGSQSGTLIIPFGDGSTATLGLSADVTAVFVPSPVLIPYTPNITNNASPTLSWNGIPGITKYNLQVANTLAFSPLLADYPNVTATSRTLEQPLPNGRIYWRVAGIDGTGVQGEFSTPGDFTVDTVAPTVQIISPSSGSPVGTTPVLKYTVSDGTVKVEVDGVQVFKSSGDKLDLLGNGVHTLRVESFDTAGNLGSDVKTFTVDNQAVSTVCTTKTVGTGIYPTTIAVDSSFALPAEDMVDAFQLTPAGDNTAITICNDSTLTLRVAINANPSLYSMFFAADASAVLYNTTTPPRIAFSYATGVPVYFTYRGSSSPYRTVDNLISDLTGDDKASDYVATLTGSYLGAYTIADKSTANSTAIAGIGDSYGGKAQAIVNSVESLTSPLPAAIPSWVVSPMFGNLNQTFDAVTENGTVKSGFVSKGQICAIQNSVAYVEFTSSVYTLDQKAILLLPENKVASDLNAYIQDQISGSSDWNDFLTAHCYGTL